MSSRFMRIALHGKSMRTDGEMHSQKTTSHSNHALPAQKILQKRHIGVLLPRRSESIRTELSISQLGPWESKQTTESYAKKSDPIDLGIRLGKVPTAEGVFTEVIWNVLGAGHTAWS